MAMNDLSITLSILILLFLVGAGSVGISPPENHNPQFLSFSDDIFLTNPLPHTTQRSHYWAMCCHEHSDYIADTYIKLDDLGVSYTRTDISWHNLEPTKGQYDQDYITHMTNVIAQLSSIDVELFAMMSHAPAWARSLYNTDKTAFWQSLQAYHSKVANLWGDKIYYYQIENEMNHPTRVPYFSESDIDDYCKYAKAGLSEHDNDFKTVLNSLCEVTGWSVDMNDWLSSGAKDHIDIIGLDMYPLTWGDTSTLWSPLRMAMSLVNQGGNPWYGKDLMVAECGFSTYDTTHNEQLQMNFIEVAIKYLNDLVIDYNQDHRGNPVLMICWYELYDAKESSLSVEDNFGICNRDTTKKLGYEALKDEIGHYEDTTWFGSGAWLPFMGIGLAVVFILILIIGYFVYVRGKKIKRKGVLKKWQSD